MTADGREWLAAQPLPLTAREQVTVAVPMIDAFDVQLAPLTKELRDYARRQTGSKALIDRVYAAEKSRELLDAVHRFARAR